MTVRVAPFQVDDLSIGNIEVDLSGLATKTYVDQAIAAIPEVGFNNLTDTPTTLVGYGITDAATSSQGDLADTAVQPNELEAYAQLSSAVFTGLVTLQQTTEKLNVITGATGAVEHDFSTGAIWLHLLIDDDFTADFTNVPTTDDRAINVVLILQQGEPGYLPNSIEINGDPQTVNWIGGLTPEATDLAIDIVSFTLIRSDSTWLVLGSVTSFS